MLQGIHLLQSEHHTEYLLCGRNRVGRDTDVLTGIRQNLAPTSAFVIQSLQRRHR